MKQQDDRRQAWEQSNLDKSIEFFRTTAQSSYERFSKAEPLNVVALSSVVVFCLVAIGGLIASVQHQSNAHSNSATDTTSDVDPRPSDSGSRREDHPQQGSVPKTSEATKGLPREKTIEPTSDESIQVRTVDDVPGLGSVEAVDREQQQPVPKIPINQRRVRDSADLIAAEFQRKPPARGARHDSQLWDGAMMQTVTERFLRLGIRGEYKPHWWDADIDQTLENVTIIKGAATSKSSLRAPERQHEYTARWEKGKLINIKVDGNTVYRDDDYKWSFFVENGVGRIENDPRNTDSLAMEQRKEIYEKSQAAVQAPWDSEKPKHTREPKPVDTSQRQRLNDDFDPRLAGVAKLASQQEADRLRAVAKSSSGLRKANLIKLASLFDEYGEILSKRPTALSRRRMDTIDSQIRTILDRLERN